MTDDMRAFEEVIYENIGHYLKHHDFPALDMDSQSFVKSFSSSQSWVAAPVTEDFLIAMIGDKAKTADIANDLFNYLNKYLLTRDSKGQLTEKEVLLIYARPIPAKHIITPIDKKLNDSAYSHVYFYRVSSNAFLCNHLTNIICDKQEVVTDEELLAQFKVAKYVFPKTLSTDPGAVWCRAKIGDIIKVTRVDDKCQEIMYREVVPR